MYIFRKIANIYANVCLCAWAKTTALVGIMVSNAVREEEGCTVAKTLEHLYSNVDNFDSGNMLISLIILIMTNNVVSDDIKNQSINK